MANISFDVIHLCQTRRIGVETRLKGYKYFEIEKDFLINLVP
jgi:hypothetical protein